MSLANHVDNWRVVPRILIFSYMIAVASSLHWYFDFEVKYTEKCDVKVMELVLEDKPKDIKAAKEAGCTITGVVGQPLGYTALMATLVGSSAGIFGFYVNSGARRDLTAT